MTALRPTYTPVTTSATALHHYRGLNWHAADTLDASYRRAFAAARELID